MNGPLTVLLAGREIGELSSRKGRCVLRYREPTGDDRGQPAAALSLSLPRDREEHAGEAVANFLWGLLPDNEAVLQRWGQRFGVSPRNVLALLGHVGEDCAGAVQIVRPDRLAAIREPRPLEVDWLDEADIAARLRALRADPAQGRRPGDTGQFSLAGAQPKTALLFHEGRWGVPRGRTPTTHILKPPTGEFDGFAENEHFCLTFARALGLPVAASDVRRFGDEVAIVVERYDRVATTTATTTTAAAAPGGSADPMPYLRLHQEDVCQALGLHPSRKYQSDGGPGPERIAGLLLSASGRPAEDAATFLDALIVNWLIAGTDAHAKNYSLLHGRGGQVRLAPLYDLASALPYGSLDRRRLKSAMRIGERYVLDEIGPRDWRRLGPALAMGGNRVQDRIAALLDRVPAALEETADKMADQHLTHSVLDRLRTALPDWIEARRRAMRGT